MFRLKNLEGTWEERVPLFGGVLKYKESQEDRTENLSNKTVAKHTTAAAARAFKEEPSGVMRKTYYEVLD